MLDMGESVKINDLINNMISLSGLTVRNEENLDGDLKSRLLVCSQEKNFMKNY